MLAISLKQHQDLFLPVLLTKSVLTSTGRLDSIVI